MRNSCWLYTLAQKYSSTSKSGFNFFENVQLFTSALREGNTAISLKFDQTFESGPKYKTSHFLAILREKREREKKTFDVKCFEANFGGREVTEHS